MIANLSKGKRLFHEREVHTVFSRTCEGPGDSQFTRTLRYYGDDKVKDCLRRGRPRYEMELEEVVGEGRASVRPPDNLVIRGECPSACAYLKDKGVKVDLVYIDPPFAFGADCAKKVYLHCNPLGDVCTLDCRLLEILLPKQRDYAIILLMGQDMILKFEDEYSKPIVPE